MPIKREMSLDAVLARVSQIETGFTSPASLATAPPSGGAAVAPASGAPAGTSPATPVTSPAAAPATPFAAQLQQALAPAPAVDPAGSPNQAIVQAAESQVGQAEQPPGSNDSPAIAQYRSAAAGAQAGEPWCAYFASWAARQAGEPLGPQGQGFGYVGDIWNWAQSTGRAIPNGPGVTPSPGDLIVFGDHHVGIVDRVLPGGSIQTIEGNYDNQVSRVVRGPGEASGYVRM